MCPEQGVHPNDDHPEGRNHQMRRVFEIWNPKTILKYPSRGATGNFYAVEKRFENNSIWEPEQAMELISGKNADHRPKIWSKMTNFIALWGFQTFCIKLRQVKFP